MSHLISEQMNFQSLISDTGSNVVSLAVSFFSRFFFFFTIRNAPSIKTSESKCALVHKHTCPLCGRESTTQGFPLELAAWEHINNLK